VNRRELEDHIAAHPLEGEPDQMRAAFRELTEIAWSKAPPGGAVSGEGYAGRLFGQKGGAPILYFHGGGYVFGSPATHRGLCSALASSARQDVLAINLPLAPERPWPAQLDAGRHALNALHARYRQPITLAGDSAGGHLALRLALEAEEVGRVAAFSPNTLRDASLSESRKAMAGRDAMNDPDADEELARLTFGTVRPDDPDQTLILQDLSRLPETYLSVGTEEVLRDDTLVFCDRAARSGARLTLRTRQGFHLEELFAPVFGPGLASVQEAGDWIRLSS
jgi:acetyl esterase/lipase